MCADRRTDRHAHAQTCPFPGRILYDNEKSETWRKWMRDTAAAAAVAVAVSEWVSELASHLHVSARWLVGLQCLQWQAGLGHVMVMWCVTCFQLAASTCHLINHVICSLCVCLSVCSSHLPATTTDYAFRCRSSSSVVMHVILVFVIRCRCHWRIRWI